MRFSGTIFHYSRDPQGFSAPDKITCLGPTNEPIYIVVSLMKKDTLSNFLLIKKFLTNELR